jgi:hypothetical protein
VPDDLNESLNGLEASAARNDTAAIIRGLKNLIPEYEPMRPATAVAEIPGAKVQKSTRPADVSLPGDVAVQGSARVG